ncbi:MAG: adenine phosphoribosyltransferase [Candidatus Dormibacter sp.]
MRPSRPDDSGAAAPAPLAGRLATALRAVPDFPRKGIVFRDISTVLGDPGLFHEAVDAMADAWSGQRVDMVAGIEARGFVLGGPVAYLLGAGFVPIRKQGRLPAAVESVLYALEYGDAVLEVHADALRRGQRVLIVDDLLATGGTACATIELVERLGATVSGLGFLVELGALGGAATLGDHDHVSLVTL